jgi:glycosyltransferase involved in cell wall biosynthesis
MNEQSGGARSGRHRRHRILAFTSSIGAGGAEKHLVRVLNHLDRSRFRVSVAVARGGGSFEGELVDTELHVLGASMKGAVCELARLIDRQAPSLIFSIMDHANCAALAAAALARWRAPVVIGVQIPPLIEWEKNPRAGHLLLRLLVPALYPRASRIVALSRGVRDDLAGWMPALADRIAVIHNAGFDASCLADSAAAPPPRAPRGPVIAACGRLVEQKGFAHLLEALALVRRQIPAELWILGEGPLRAPLEEQARRAGVGDAVWFAGFQASPQAYVKQAQVFVLSSLWEGFANVVVEAMAVGTPVVATDCPHGPGEIIRDAGEGLLVPPADPGALAAAIVRVLQSEDLRRSLSQRAQVRAQDFAASRIAARYAEVFLDAILASTGSSGALSEDIETIRHAHAPVRARAHLDHPEPDAVTDTEESRSKRLINSPISA